MPPTRSPTAYKKNYGTLEITADRKYVFWIPSIPPGSSPAVTIPIPDITNLQATPATAKQFALRIFVKDATYTFDFTDKKELSDRVKGQELLEATKQILSDVVASNKAKEAGPLPTTKDGAGAPDGAVAKGNGGQSGEGQSAAMAIAKAVSSKIADEGWYDDDKLKSDVQLQRSLLESNRALQDIFSQAMKDKPESVSVSQFTSQFWSARIHLLRAHAIENAQKQGEYNVLPEIKFVREVAQKEGEEDVLRLNITGQQIKLLFKQYPVLREAYNENVPPMQQNEFWTRFFRSRLLKKLKGERISDHDERDMILDKYLERPEGGAAYPVAHIPHWMDLEGNEQNHSQRKGNRPDEDMRPSGHEKAPILRILNSLSEKMMAHIPPEDSEAHAPIGMDEGTFEQLRLKDLAMEDIDNRVILNVREQQRYAGGDRDDLSAEAKLYAKQDPNKVLEKLRSSLQPSRLGADERGTLRLDRAIGYKTDDDESGSDSEAPAKATNGTKKPAKFGSHAAMSSASRNIISSVRQRRLASSSDPHSLHGLSQATYDGVVMTHNTTTEFLHYFWSVFVSGDAARAAELAQLVAALDRSLDRINAVGARAEAERDTFIASLHADDRAYFERTKKRRRRDYDLVPGGRAAVEALLRPTVQALDRATAAYRKAFEEQSREANAVATA